MQPAETGIAGETEVFARPMPTSPLRLPDSLQKLFGGLGRVWVGSGDLRALQGFTEPLDVWWQTCNDRRYERSLLSSFVCRCKSRGGERPTSPLPLGSEPASGLGIMISSSLRKGVGLQRSNVESEITLSRALSRARVSFKVFKTLNLTI
jgi:hypothetical protein